MDNQANTNPTPQPISSSSQNTFQPIQVPNISGVDPKKMAEINYLADKATRDYDKLSDWYKLPSRDSEEYNKGLLQKTNDSSQSVNATGIPSINSQALQTLSNTSSTPNEVKPMNLQQMPVNGITSRNISTQSPAVQQYSQPVLNNNIVQNTYVNNNLNNMPQQQMRMPNTSTLTNQHTPSQAVPSTPVYKTQFGQTVVPGRTYYDEFGRPVQVMPQNTSQQATSPQQFIPQQTPTQMRPFPPSPIQQQQPNTFLNNRPPSPLPLVQPKPIQNNVVSSSKVEQGGTQVENKPEDTKLIETSNEVNEEEKVTELVQTLKEEIVVQRANRLHDNSANKTQVASYTDIASEIGKIKLSGYPISSGMVNKLIKTHKGRNDLWKLLDPSSARSWMYALASKFISKQKQLIA